jgi:hypothetical protein
VPDSNARRLLVLDFVGSCAAVEHTSVFVFRCWCWRVVVSQSIPLGTLLWVEVIFVVECDAFCDPFYAVFKWFAAESWFILVKYTLYY